MIWQEKKEQKLTKYQAKDKYELNVATGKFKTFVYLIYIIIYNPYFDRCLKFYIEIFGI